jgi:anti-sigma regulatory factor (Ser/Thr protein kinase)
LSDQQCIAVTEASQVGEARRVAARLAQAAGLGEADVGRITLLVTELGNNLARYAQGGKMLVQTLPTENGPIAEVIATDNGPGMSDVQRCLQDGYSTGGTPGTGLGAVRRQASAFDVHSLPGRGTVVVARVSDDRNTAASSTFVWSAVSIPKAGEIVCGDSWRVTARGRDLSVLVADGLGHGPFAAEAAMKARAVFDEDTFNDPRVIVERAHAALTGSRGAAIAIARVSNGSSLHYAGVGNISGSLMSAERSAGMMSQNGTVGVQLRKVQQMEYSWPPRSVLIMHSDGLSHRWSLDAYPGLLMRHPAVVAGVLSRDFSRGHDDATVVVIGGRAEESAHA